MKIIFPHIWKTGGTSFSEVLYRIFPEDQRLRVEDKPLSEYKNKKFLFGHMPYGLHNVLTGEYKYIGLVRDPIERVISSYYFMREQKAHPMYNIVNKLTLRETLESTDKYLLDNYNNHQVRIFAGIETEVSKGRIKCLFKEADTILEEHLDDAISNINKDYIFISTLEDINCSKLFNALEHKEENCSCPHIGKTSYRLSRDEIDKETIKIIHDLNQLDIKLYKYIKTEQELVL